MAEKSVRTCPRCNSPDVHNNFANIGVVLGLAEEYTCENCGYTAALFPETPVSAFEKEEYEVRDIPAAEREEAHNTERREQDRRTQYLYAVTGLLAVYMIFFTPRPTTFLAVSVAVFVALVWTWLHR